MNSYQLRVIALLEAAHDADRAGESSSSPDR